MNRPPLSLLDEQEQMLFDTALDFGRREVAPHVRAMDAAGALRPDIVSALFKLGLMGVEVPEEYGGADASFFSAILVVEALAQVDPSVSVLVDVQNTLVQNTLLRAGTPEQKKQFLPGLCKNMVGSYALSEATSGSDAFALRTRALKKGDGYLLSGEKMWITNAAESDLFIVFATVDPSRAHRGITAYLVERSMEGFSVAKKESKLGIRASSTCALSLENVYVPPSHVLGEIGLGYKIAIETLNEGRIGIGAQMLGLAEAALSHAVNYTQQRKQFGTRISEFQAVRFELAELRTDIEAARLLVYNAARLKDAGAPFVTEAAMAKLRASEVAEKTASAAVEMLGGVGFTQEYPVEKLYRDAKIGKIYEGTSNMQRSTIAKALLDSKD